jgi:hypothetical protein
VAHTAPSPQDDALPRAARYRLLPPSALPLAAREATAAYAALPPLMLTRCPGRALPTTAASASAPAARGATAAHAALSPHTDALPRATRCLLLPPSALPWRPARRRRLTPPSPPYADALPLAARCPLLPPSASASAAPQGDGGLRRPLPLMPTRRLWPRAAPTAASRPRPRQLAKRRRLAPPSLEARADAPPLGCAACGCRRLGLGGSRSEGGLRRPPSPLVLTRRLWPRRLLLPPRPRPRRLAKRRRLAPPSLEARADAPPLAALLAAAAASASASAAHKATAACAALPLLSC